MKLTKTSKFRGFGSPGKTNKLSSEELYARNADRDLENIFIGLKGRIRFGTGTDGDRGENIAGEFQVITDTGTADAEITLGHGLGAVPIGYIVVKINGGGVVYDSGTTWTSTNIYLKCSSANATTTLFLLK